jgi:hypothetical protein
MRRAGKGMFNAGDEPGGVHGASDPNANHGTDSFIFLLLSARSGRRRASVF